MSYTRLSLDPDGYWHSSTKATTAAKHLELAGEHALKALFGLAHMGGDDEAGGKFAHGYDKYAAAIFDGLGYLCTALSQTATTFAASAVSHANAEAANAGQANAGSVVPSHPVRATTTVTFAHPASAYGGTNVFPQGWTFVQALISAAWPDGDTGKMRHGRTAWNALADDIDHAASKYISTLLDPLDGFQAPDIAAITAATSKLEPAARELSAECRALAEVCGTYADAVDSAHQESEKELAEFMITSAAAIGISVLLTPLTAGVSDLVGGAAVAADAVITAGRVSATLAQLVARVAPIMVRLGELSRATPTLTRVIGKSLLFAGKAATTTSIWTVSGLGGDLSVNQGNWTPLEDLKYSVVAGVFGEAGKAGGKLLSTSAKGWLSGVDRAATQTVAAEVAEAGAAGGSDAEAAVLGARHRLPVGPLQPVLVTVAVDGSKSILGTAGTFSGALAGEALTGGVDPSQLPVDIGKDGVQALIPILERGGKHAPHFLIP